MQNDICKLYPFFLFCFERSSLDLNRETQRFVGKILNISMLSISFKIRDTQITISQIYIATYMNIERKILKIKILQIRKLKKKGS